MKLPGKFNHFLLMTAGTLIMAVGNHFFKFTNNFTFGGITGLAVLVAEVTNFSAADFSMIANMVLLAIGTIVLGKKFVAKTAYCSILLSVSLSLLERFCPMTKPFTNEPLLELIYAITLPALGSAILFNISSSSGGSDIIAMIFKKYSSFNIGSALILTDFLTVAIGCYVFGMANGLYSFVGLVVRSFLVDNFIESINLSKYFNVVCSKPDDICNYIVEELHRSATICNAQGAFSGEQKYIIFTALNRHQAVKLRNFIKTNDPTAFILISNISEIIGKGFHTI